MATLIESWPGGICTASGGTRTAVKLSRPWQKDIVVDPSTCPFEPENLKDREVFGRSEKAGGWLVLGNPFTPHSFHRLIIPTHCWPKEKLRLLGGEECINAAVRLAYQVMDAEGREVLELTVHIGALAGQNIPHLHYHIVEPIALPAGKQLICEVLGFDDLAQLIFTEGDFGVLAGGHRAGQCLIVPQRRGDLSHHRIAAVLARLVALYCERFQSTEGLAPDDQIGLKFVGGEFDYGIFLPILNHWGATEYFALLGTGPIILPWPHEETVKHLLGKERE